MDKEQLRVFLVGKANEFVDQADLSEMTDEDEAQGAFIEWLEDWLDV